MNDTDDKQICKILKVAIEPIGERELQKDLWYQVQKKIPRPGISVSVFDCVLAFLAAILSFLAPEAFLVLLTNL